MRPILLLPLLASIAAFAPAQAADDAAKAAASAPSQGCGKTATHDQGAGKGNPSAKSAKSVGCGGSDAASAPTRKKEKTHDHAKVHKTM